MESYNIYVFYENIYKYLNLYEVTNWSMRKYFGWLDFEIRNIWTTNRSIDRAKLDYTTFDKNWACGWDLHWVQQINTNKF